MGTLPLRRNGKKERKGDEIRHMQCVSQPRHAPLARCANYQATLTGMETSRHIPQTQLDCIVHILLFRLMIVDIGDELHVHTLASYDNLHRPSLSDEEVLFLRSSEMGLFPPTVDIRFKKCYFQPWSAKVYESSSKTAKVLMIVVPFQVRGDQSRPLNTMQDV